MNPSRRQILHYLSALSISPLVAKAGNLSSSRADIVVIGGGYAGSTICKYLRIIAPNFRITLVEPKLHYLSCPGSNAVISGMMSFDQLTRDYQKLTARYKVRHLRDTANKIKPSRNQVQLKSGRKLHYDRLVVAPGVDFQWNSLDGYNKEQQSSIPHAWQAGPQTKLLADQLKKLKQGGTIIITVPRAPFRCPPGPYERASLMANYCRHHNSRAKILILDANTHFPKQALFKKGWDTLYPGIIEWLPWTETGPLESLNVSRRILHTEFGQFQGDLINYIPPQTASLLAAENGLIDQSGWCPIDPLTFESRLQPGVHVLGDAAIIPPMPKSAFAANSQAKACAASIVSLISGYSLPAEPLINTCYSHLAENYAISVAAVYGYQQGELVTRSSGVTPMNADRAKEAKAAKGWYLNIHNDAFA